MRRYLTAYLKQIEDLLGRTLPPDFDYDALIDRHLNKIQFMQHERLVHFLVTMLFALGMFIVMGVFLITETLLLLPLLLLILVLLVPYIMHYYFLENSVQKMYRLYDEMLARRAEQEKAFERLHKQQIAEMKLTQAEQSEQKETMPT